MTSDVVLTAALRNNLLSLQRTQGLIDKTQLRLATGLKVNSALDNPQNFFASQALKNRASDLNRLLDGIGQNIQVIKAADNGVTALTKLIEQADSVVQSARDALAQGSAEAKILGDKDLRGIADLTQLSGVFDATNVTTVDSLVISVVDPETDSLVDFDEATTVQDNLTIDIYQGDSIDELITRINDNNNISEPVVEASLDADGRLQLRTLNGGDISVQFSSANGTASEDLALAEALGFGQVARLNGDGPVSAEDNVSVTASAATVLKSFEFFQDGTAGATRAVRSDLLVNVSDDNDVNYFSGLDNAGDEFTISVDGATPQVVELNGLTIQGFIDAINTNASLNTLIKADFDDATSQITLRAIDPTVQDITIGAYGDTGAEDINFGFGTTTFDAAAIGATNADTLEETIRFGAASGKLAELEGEYNNIRSQIDELVSNGDTGYRGTNLLFGDDLTTFFNESRSSSLDTEGVEFNSAGLGLNEASFASAETIDAVGEQVRAALEQVRSFGVTLANDLAIIQTRENFTQDIINTLNEGSDKLTVADQNEEGAKLLSLQTRQQLGVTSLSLASQSQQSILRLF